MKQPTTEKIGKKPVFYNEAKTIITLKSHFQEKLLCDGPTFSTGVACVFSCSFCYVASQLLRTAQTRVIRNEGLKFEDTVIRRENPIEVVKGQLLDRDGKPKYNDPADRRVIYASPLVDVAATQELVTETVEVCKLILEHTHWQIRLLSKCKLLYNLAGKIPEQWKNRMIYGLSLGTLDDKLAAAFERGTSSSRSRLNALHKLQDEGYRTFGMICPSLPQHNYDEFAQKMAEAIRVDRCEHVWAEVINLRGQSFIRTIKALEDAELDNEADLLTDVKSGDRWEEYARQTFLAHTKFIPADKLRFMQYVNSLNREWWRAQEENGALLLGKAAEEKAPANSLTQEQKSRFKALDKTVATAAKAFVDAGLALYEIRSEKLYREKFTTFEDYCRGVHEISRQYANNLIRAGKTYRKMETIVSKTNPTLADQLPKLLQNEGRLRELTRLPNAERQVEVLEELVGNPRNGKVTSGQLRQMVDERLSRVPQSSSKAATLRQRIDGALITVDEIELALNEGDEQGLTKALERMRGWLNGKVGRDL